MLRRRKNRRYNETNDDDGDRKFDLQHQIKTERFDQIRDKHLQERSGDEITLRLIQRHGFEKPILVRKPDGLDLRVPPKSFLVRDVRNSVGHQRIIDVMDVKTQKNIEMSMKDWCKYYESKNRDRLLNVISLEFSHTKLDELVESPGIVRLLDWVDLVWPKFLKESQTESTNTITKMMYPKVQKYCLMSVKGSYTDFHIDFGGTSVWYHILRGRKIFWMVPPTELNLQIFEEWTLSGMQQDVFFGDTVEECFRVELAAGNTFFIPSGWIHAVYTIEDSLVFGGNFLHSFGIENQLKVSKIEDATKVPIKFRYPFYTEILWYVAQHYVFCLMNKDHLHQHEVMKAVENTKAALMAKAKNVEIEDESTETELDETDTKPSKSPATKATKRKKAPAKTAKSTSKKSKKVPTPPPTDDDSTEIDTEEDEPSVKKPPVATCRMTKNSLLRLQYEIEEKSPSKLSASPAKPSDGQAEKKPKKIKSEQQTVAPITTNHSTTINLAEFALSNDSKPNGWINSSSSSAGPQPHVWSTPASGQPEVKKIHITKYELNGLKALLAHLSKLSKAKKNLPTLIRNSRALLDDCRKLIAEHENDDPELAVTGIPITPELLNTPKKTDINELIGQFFKSTETTDKDESSPKKQGHLSVVCNQNKSRIENSHHRSRQSSQLTDTTNGGDSTEPANHKGSEAESVEGPSKAAQRETKCLSPNKKLIHASALSAHASTSTPTQRPKSPPTRPLSMNQYSSKTKSQQPNNNLLLPGSFADLIAATSTEKVFDVTGADVTSSLLGGKDLGPSNKSSSATPSSSSSASRERDKPTHLDPARNSGSLFPHLKTCSTIDSLSSTPSAAGSAKEPQRQHAQSPSDSPKLSPQKRFIIPNQFKPANKEKLIFASAPYVSPVNSSDQSRPGDPYPWQTPARASDQQPKHFSPTNQPPLSTQPPIPSKLSTPNHSTSPTPPKTIPTPTLQTSTHQDSHIISPTTKSPAQAKDTVPTRNIDIDQSKIEQTSQGKPEVQFQQPAQRDANAQSNTAQPSAIRPAEPQVAEVKKPVKPRGPPKKSKEARQVLDNEPDVKPFVPISVIKAGPSSTVIVDSTAQSAQPKPKPKRSKKQKDDGSPMPAVPRSVIKPPQSHAPVICGLMAPPTNTAATAAHKIAPQPYLVTRPLMFNPLTSLSAAQYQQMQRTPTMPLFTSPMVSGASSLGSLPFQQGARIVWATQPRLAAPTPQGATGQSTSVIRSPMASTTTPKVSKNSSSPTTAGSATSMSMSKTKMTTNTTIPTSTAHSDNAALLSLATTALSTASMIPSPTLSHFSHLMPSNQAIVVSSATGNPQALFAGQQYLRPAFLPAMPMAHFVGQPGVMRPPTSGQLVFARLPNQNQPRYLITQPGFMQQRLTTPPHIVTSQSASTLAYAAFKPPSESPKELKSKKVKTS